MRKNELDSEESKFRRLQNPSYMINRKPVEVSTNCRGANGQYKVSALNPATGLVINTALLIENLSVQFAVFFTVRLTL